MDTFGEVLKQAAQARGEVIVPGGETHRCGNE